MENNHLIFRKALLKVRDFLKSWAQAIKDRYFVLVELSFNYQPAEAHFIAQQMAASRNYDLIDKIPFQNSFGRGYFYLWRSATVAEHDNFTRLSQVKV